MTKGQLTNLDDYQGHSDPEDFRRQYDAIRDKYQIPLHVVTVPGRYGSTGDTFDDHTFKAVITTNEVINKLKIQHNKKKICISGHSNGGNIVAGLIPRRDDIACAVISSATLNSKGFVKHPRYARPFLRCNSL